MAVRYIIIIISLFGTVILLSNLLGSCRKNHDFAATTALQQEIPEGFPAPVYRFQDNPLTKEGFELGRELFYDGRLSINGLYPCASCHQQIAAFGTFEHDRSHGYNGSHTLRNAPVLFNLAWQNSFHWDGQYSSLIDEAVHPITGATEMAETMDGVINKLKADAQYREKFRRAFGTNTIRAEHLLKALAQFTGYLTSANSKFDRYKKGTTALSQQELSGYEIYKSHCSGCHPEPLFSDYSFRNIGLPVDSYLNDFGKMRITGLASDSLKFKVPTLRNVYISSNYMHDGRFNTLAQCINHYRHGVQRSPTLDAALSGGITLTDAEAFDLAIFLRTLTDSSFLTDSRFSKP